MTRLTGLLLVILIVMAATGCGTTVTPEKAEPSETPEVQQPETFEIGEAVKAGKVHVTLHQVRTWEGDEWNKPEEGHVHLIPEATIENISEEAYHASTLMQWSAVDQDGVKYNIALVTDLKGSLDGEIGPGRKIRGEIAFEVERGKEYEIIFEPETFGSGQVIWNVGIVE